MILHPMKLVTIVCEALAREPLTVLLHEVGVNGYTLFTVEGSGRLLGRLEKDFFPRYAMVAYESDVRVLRPHKF